MAERYTENRQEHDRHLETYTGGERRRSPKPYGEGVEMESIKVLIKFGILAIGLWSFLIYGFNKAEGAVWELFQTTSAGNIYYYDAISVERFPKGILQVWVRIIETAGFSKADLEKLKDPERAEEVIKKAQKNSWSEWKQLFEINCSGRLFRVLSATLYDRNGNIKENYELPSEWTRIPQNSVTNRLAEILCL